MGKEWTHGSHLILTLEQTNNVWKCNFIFGNAKALWTWFRRWNSVVKSCFWSVPKSFGIPKMRLDFLNTVFLNSEVQVISFNFQISYSAIYFLLYFTLLLCLQGVGCLPMRGCSTTQLCRLRSSYSDMLNIFLIFSIFYLLPCLTVR